MTRTGEPTATAAALEACARVWAAYGRLEPLDPADVALVGGLTGPQVQDWFRSRGPVERVAVTDAAAHLPPGFAEYVAGFLTLGSREWAEHLDRCAFPGPAARRKVQRNERYVGWLDRAVRDGDVRFADPASGREVSAADAVLVFDRTVYSFFGDTLFLLLAGGAGSRAIGVLVPAENRLYDFGAQLGTAVSPDGMANVLGLLLRRLAAHADDYARALAERGRCGPRRVVLMVGKAQNPAHHLWNYYTGVERLVRAGLADRVTEVHVAGTEFFGPVTGVFPELTGAELHRDARTALWDPHPFSATHLLVPTGGYFIPCSLTDRLHGAMRRLPSSGAADPSSAPYGRPLVWIGLRLGDKSWADQETEVPRLVDRLHARFPSATVLLDGWSYPLAHDEVSRRWAATIADLTVLVETVVGRVAHPDRLVGMVGNTLRESVLWAREVDAWIAPTGSTQHKVGWLTDAPGIVYASPALARVDPAGRPGAWESERSALPRYLFGTPVDAGARRDRYDRRVNIDNLRLDVGTLLAGLEEILGDRYPPGGSRLRTSLRRLRPARRRG